MTSGDESIRGCGKRHKGLCPAEAIPRDPVVEAVREDLLQHSQIGVAKYGVTLARTDLSLRDWLQHAYEETIDQANYLKRAIISLDTDKAVLADQVKAWIEGMQPTDLQNRTTAELQDELQRRMAETLRKGTSGALCPHNVPWDDCPDCRH